MNRSAHPFGERRRRVQRAELPQPATVPPLTHPVATTVLVFTFNDGPYIEDCIASLLVQSVLPVDILVHDNGSTDDTLERLRHYASRITLISGTATTPGPRCEFEALHLAVAQAAGDLILLLNGHDRFKRDKIASYAAVYRANPDAVLIQAPLDRIDPHGRVEGQQVEPRKHVVDHLKEIKRTHDVDFYYPRSALAFSRQYLQSLLPLEAGPGFSGQLETMITVVAPYFGRVITLPHKLTDARRRAPEHQMAQRHPRRFHLQQTWVRTRIFNQFCRRHGLRSISPWHNTRFYLQLLRYALPDLAYHVFNRKLRQRFNPPASSVR